MRKGFGIGQPQSKAVALGALTFGLWNQTAVADVTYRATYDYDELGRRIRERNAANTIVASYTYDRNGNLISITDALGRRTELSYDALRRVTQSKDAAGSITSYAYDAGGRAVQVIDPRGLATRYDYDGFGSLWTQTSPDSGVTQFTYDAAGQLTRMTRADGSGLDYQYDGLGRLTSYGRGWEYRSFAYDNCAYGKGRLCHAVAADSQLGTSTDTYLAYTAQGNTASKREVTADWSESRDHTVLYGYDGLGRLSSISYPSGVSVDYGYADGHLSAMTVHTSDGSQAVVSGARYQPFGSAESWLYGNGLTRRYNHDLDGRLTGISAGTPTSIMQSLTYGYNAGNEITAITNGVNSAFSQAYEYDSLSRLTRASRSLQEERFTYDANGNRLRHAIVNAQTSGIGPQPYPIAPTAAPTRAITSQEFVLEYESGSNRLLRRSGPDGSTNYRYNQQGHRIATQSDGAVSYTGAFDQNYQYDTFNRLIGMGIQGAMDATYLYNALDQRVATGHFSGLNATFVYADQNRLLGELGTSGEWKDYL